MDGFGATGCCTCPTVRYRMTSKPLVVHCCQCTRRQRASGASFALNAMIEPNRAEMVSGEPEAVMMFTASCTG